MKKNLTVFMLYVRFAVYRLLIVLLALLALDLAVYALLDRAGSFMNMTAAELLFASAYAAVIVVCLCPASGHSHFGYTLQRLRISEKSVFLHHCSSNFCVFLILWFTQAAVLFVLARHFAAETDLPVGPQGLMLEFYVERFLHGVLPLGMTSLWVRNVLFAASAAICCAYAALALRSGNRRPLFPFIILALIMIEFPVSLNLGYGGGILAGTAPFGLSLICLSIALDTASGGKHREEELETP